MKKFMRIAFVAAFAAIAGYGVYTNLKTDVMSDLALANVEALARNEVDQIKCNQAMGGTCVLINNTPIPGEKVQLIRMYSAREKSLAEYK